MYITYDKYVELGGTAKKTAFIQHERRARKLINLRTQNRLIEEETTDDLMYCMFDLIQLLEEKCELENNKVSSVGNDGYSVSYRTNSPKEIQEEYMTRAYATIVLYLQDYCYRGINHD